MTINSRYRYVCEVLGGFLLPCLLIFGIGIITDLTTSFGGMDFDGQHYASMHAAMSRQGLLNSTDPVALRAPYCWRVGAPFLASLLWDQPVHAFQNLAKITTLLTLIILYCGCRKMGMTPALAMTAQCLYTGVFWTVKFSFYSPCYVDWSMMLFLAALPYFLTGSAVWWTPLLFAAGVLFKETVIFASPTLLAAHGSGSLTRMHRLLLFIASVAAGVTVIAVLRTMITPQITMDSLEPLHMAVQDLVSARFWRRFPLEILSGLGILPLLLFAPVNLRQWWRKHPWLAVWLLMGLLVIWGGKDKARLFLFVAVPMAITGANILGLLWQKGLGARLWIGTGVLFHAYLGHHLFRIVSFNEYLESMVPRHFSGSLGLRSIIVVVVAAFWLAAGRLIHRKPGL